MGLTSSSNSPLGEDSLSRESRLEQRVPFMNLVELRLGRTRHGGAFECRRVQTAPPALLRTSHDSHPRSAVG